MQGHIYLGYGRFYADDTCDALHPTHFWCHASVEEAVNGELHTRYVIQIIHDDKNDPPSNLWKDYPDTWRLPTHLQEKLEQQLINLAHEHFEPNKDDDPEGFGVNLGYVELPF